MKSTIQVSHFVRDGRFHQQILDCSGAEPRVIAGYSYATPARHGQVDAVPGLSMEERSRCHIRNHRHHTTVNGVCLDCARSKGHHGGGRR